MMDLQTRKLKVIEYLIGLTDEDVFKVIEDVVNKSGNGKHHSIEPFTQQELIDRAKISNENYLTGKFKDQHQLERESKNW